MAEITRCEDRACVAKVDLKETEENLNTDYHAHNRLFHHTPAATCMFGNFNRRRLPNLRQLVIAASGEFGGHQVNPSANQSAPVCVVVSEFVPSAPEGCASK